MTTPNIEAKSIHEAILNAKQEFKPLKKSGKNPHFKNEYSTLDDIRDATLEALTKHKIIVVHGSAVNEDYTVLNTYLFHTPTNTVINASFFVDNDAPQKMGSAMTYGRRYNIVNLLDLIADVDDDGESFNALPTSSKTAGRRKGLGGKVS